MRRKITFQATPFDYMNYETNSSYNVIFAASAAMMAYKKLPRETIFKSQYLVLGINLEYIFKHTFFIWNSIQDEHKLKTPWLKKCGWLYYDAYCIKHLASCRKRAITTLFISTTVAQLHTCLSLHHESNSYSKQWHCLLHHCYTTPTRLASHPYLARHIQVPIRRIPICLKWKLTSICLLFPPRNFWASSYLTYILSCIW